MSTWYFTPTIPIPAPRIGQATVPMGTIAKKTHGLLTTRFCRGINLLGYPALSIPCGDSRAELCPWVLQIHRER